MEKFEEEVRLVLNKRGRGTFVLIQNDERAGVMEVAIDGENLIVFHTESFIRGVGHVLLEAMAFELPRAWDNK